MPGARLIVPLLLTCLATSLARADELPRYVLVDPSRVEPAHPPVALSVVLGLGAALVPMVVGGVMAGTRNLHDETAGIYTVMGGLALAPALTHVFAHEWARAGYFTAVPLACALGMVAQVQARPQTFVEDDKNDSRWTFAILLSVGVVSSAVGVVDSLLASERARRHRLMVAPMLSTSGPKQGGMAVGGVF